MAFQLARANAEVAPAAPPAELLSLEQLYDQHADFVYRTLVSLRLSPAAAEDALQEVFLVAHRRLPEFCGSFYKSWLYRIATSVAQNARRSQSRLAQRSAEVDLGALPAPRAEEPYERAAHSERVELLARLLEQLHEKEREVFILAELEQITQEEIAEALGVHVNTVAYRLRAAKQALEKLIRNQQRDRGASS